MVATVRRVQLDVDGERVLSAGEQGPYTLDRLELGLFVLHVPASVAEGPASSAWISASHEAKLGAVKHELALCLIFRDEASYLAEWLRFHDLVGVDHFFLYDHQSSDQPLDVLRQTLAEDRWTLIPWQGAGAQVAAYRHCLEYFGPRCRWLGFIDIDEFLFSPDGKDLRGELDARASAPGLVVNGLLFGTSGHATRPGGPVTAAYTWRAREDTVYRFPSRLRQPTAPPDVDASYFPMSAHVKCVVQPARTVTCESPHRFRYEGGIPAVSETGAPTEGNYTAAVSVQALRLHHYWSRSGEEFRRKMGRSRVSGRASYEVDVGLAVEATMHQVCDLTLTRSLDSGSGFPRVPPAALSWVPMHAEYRGEEQGSCARYPDQRVRYSSPDEARAFEVSVREGLLVDCEGAPLTTPPSDGDRPALCSLSPDGRLCA